MIIRMNWNDATFKASDVVKLLIGFIGVVFTVATITNKISNISDVLSEIRKIQEIQNSTINSILMEQRLHDMRLKALEQQAQRFKE